MDVIPDTWDNWTRTIHRYPEFKNMKKPEIRNQGERSFYTRFYPQREVGMLSGKCL